MRKVRNLAAVSALVLAAIPMVQGPAAAEASPTTLYFHSSSQAGNVDHYSGNTIGGPGMYMDDAAPTKADPSIGSTVLRGTYPKGSVYGPAWTAPATGTVVGDATVSFWASGAATQFDVHLFVDQNINDDAYAPFASKSIPVTPSPTPQQYTASFSGLNKAVASEVIVQITPVTRTPAATLNGGDVNVYYDAVDYPSALTISIEAPPSVPSTAAYELYEMPGGFTGAHGPNELSIGVNPETNTAMVLASLSTAALTWDDTVSPPRAIWKDVSFGPTATATFDPYLFTDRVTGRTFVQQLVGEMSIAAFTDDDGKTWTLTDPPTTAPSFDHESLAAGPYPAGHEAAAGNAYGRAVYYCSQGVLIGQCARSDDGGESWNLPVDFSTLGRCFPSHGRVVVDDLGNVYLPVDDCGDFGQGVYISRDAGSTWEEHFVPGTRWSNSDPVVNLDSAGRVYYTAASGGTILVSTSDDRGKTFSQPVNVGALAGIKQAEMPMAVAGDAGRIAVAFYGSTTPGDGTDPEYTGEWDVYVGTSIEGGQTWSVIDITPDDAAQRGFICMSGTTCDTGRNLLDFQGMTMDADGRVLVAYADGCTTDACKNAVGKTNADAGSSDSLATIARQMTGPFLKAS